MGQTFVRQISGLILVCLVVLSLTNGQVISCSQFEMCMVFTNLCMGPSTAAQAYLNTCYVSSPRRNRHIFNFAFSLGAIHNFHIRATWVHQQLLSACSAGLHLVLCMFLHVCCCRSFAVGSLPYPQILEQPENTTEGTTGQLKICYTCLVHSQIIT